MRSESQGNILFKRTVPSAFIVTSPLQLLCAIEAQKEFEILDAKYFLILHPEGLRNKQMLAMSQKFKIDFVEVYSDEISQDNLFNKEGVFEDIDKCTKYERIFIGDYTDYYSSLFACKIGCKGTQVLFMDDGLETISTLQKKTDVPKPISFRKKMHWLREGRFRRFNERKRLNAILNQHGIEVTQSFFSIFYNVKSKHYTIYPNQFRNIRKEAVVQETEPIVLIVGSCITQQCEMYNIPEAEYESILWNKLCTIKNNIRDTHPIIYIPHGRDENTHIPEFCKILNIKYQRINEALEWFVLNSGITPVEIFGSGSAALYTLKCLYPDAKVVNWFVDKKEDNPMYYVQKRYANFYKRNGIIEETIRFPKPLLLDKIKNIKYDIQSILDWINDRILKKIKL